MALAPTPRPPVAPKDVGGGDDLAEDFELDPAFSDDGDDAGSADFGLEFDGDRDAFPELDFDDADDGIRDVRTARAVKRKASQTPLDVDAASEARTAESPKDGTPSKKKKKPKRPKLDKDAGAAFDPATAGPSQLSDWFRAVLQSESRTRGLSALELEEAALPEQCFEDTSRFTATASARTADALPAFIRSTLPKLATRIAQRPKTQGAPTCLVLCAAALRVTDLCRVLKASGLRGEKGGEVAKLFAKHFKLKEHVDYLAKTRVSVAVATPGRLLQLLAQDAMPLTALTHVIFDESHRDTKERRLCDVPEVRTEVVSLMRGALGDKIRAGNVQVVVY